MPVEVFAGIGAIKNVYDLLKIVTEKNNESEINAAIIEVQSHLVTIQQDLINAQQKIQEMERLLETYDNWEEEKNKYELRKLDSSFVAYAPVGKLDEITPHLLCPNCFEKRIKSLMSPTDRGAMRRTYWKCGTCNAEQLADSRRLDPYFLPETR